MLLPYANHRHVANTFGQPFADALATLPTAKREAVILEVCTVIESVRAQRLIRLDQRNIVVEVVRGMPRVPYVH